MSDDKPLASNENNKGEPTVAPFDRWLDRKLKGAYGAVLEEPIPQDIIDLLRKKLDKED